MAEDEAKKRRREMLLALFALLLLTTEDAIRNDVGRLVSGQIDPYHFGVHMGAILAPAHANAAYLGRQFAGVTHPFDMQDAAFGRAVADEQREYLLPFVDAIAREQNPLSVEAIEQRALLYAKRILGTANEAWARSLPANTLIYWDDRGDAHECEDCKTLARNGPYTPKTLPTVPGNCDTRCLVNCKCRLYTEDGQEGFAIT